MTQLEGGLVFCEEQVVAGDVVPVEVLEYGQPGDVWGKWSYKHLLMGWCEV